MVGDAVEQSADEALVGGDGGPFVEAQVGGHDVGAVLAARAEQVEPQPAARLLQGEGTELAERATLGHDAEIEVGRRVDDVDRAVADGDRLLARRDNLGAAGIVDAERSLHLAVYDVDEAKEAFRRAHVPVERRYGTKDFLGTRRGATAALLVVSTAAAAMAQTILCISFPPRLEIFRVVTQSGIGVGASIMRV